MKKFKLGFRGEILIKSFEELALEAYLCPAGVWTIGWGHTEGVKSGDIIDKYTAVKYFMNDVEWAVNYVNERLRSPTTQSQFDAMVSLVFNIGQGGFRTSTVLRLHNMNWDFGACIAFMMWRKIKGKDSRGLLIRRLKEALLYCEDNWGKTDG